MKARVIIQNIGLSLLGFAFTLCVIEFLAREYAAIALKGKIVTYDNALGWKLIPNARNLYAKEEVPYQININSHGLRAKDYSYTKPTSTFRIVVIGDSFVFGSGGVSAGERFTEIIETYVPRLEVINMGIPGFSLDQEYLLLTQEGFKYKPDIVILCTFENDFEESFVTFNKWIGRPKGYVSMEGNRLRFVAPRISLLYVLTDRSYILGAIENKLRIFVRPDKQAGVQLTFDEKNKVFRDILLELSDACRRSSAELVIVNIPAKWEKTRNVIQDILAGLARTDGIKVLDLMDLLENSNLEKSPYFERDIHLNPFGHQFVAKRLFEFLEQNTSLREHENGAGLSHAALH